MNAPGPPPPPTSKAWRPGRGPGSDPVRRHAAASRRRPHAGSRAQAARAQAGPGPGAGPAGSGRRHGAGQQANSFGTPGLFEEPDLFSELEEEPAGAAARRGASPEAVVESLERELLRPETRADLGRTGVLLHPDFTEIGSSGRIWTRDAMMMALEDDPGGPTELELLGADRLGEKRRAADLPQPHAQGVGPPQLPVGPGRRPMAAALPSGHARGLRRPPEAAGSLRRLS